MLNLHRISYADLNARQRENYNFQKISAILADFGFATIRLSDDWQGADFIAQHIDGSTFLKVQLKGRCTIAKHYLGKDLMLAFPDTNNWYMIPHDELVDLVLTARPDLAETTSWADRGFYSFPGLSLAMVDLLYPYRVAGDLVAVEDPTS